VVFAAEMEGVAKGKRFSYVGGILFNRMIKWTLGLFGAGEKEFAKLRWIGQTLALEKVEELSQLWGEKCTAEDKIGLALRDLKVIISLRADWAGTDVSFLNLL
jgi:hypothetical protein